MGNILERLWKGIVRFFLSTFYVWIAVIVGVIAGLIWGLNVGVFTFFGIVLAVILYVWGRQIWWFVSGTGDYHGRVGLIKALYLWLFKKNDKD